MGMYEIEQEMIKGQLFKDPEKFIVWMSDSFVNTNHEGIQTISFAFRLMDNLGVTGDEVDKIYNSIIKYADDNGIKPWPNIDGPRLQASTCLVGFLEKLLNKK